MTRFGAVTAKSMNIIFWDVTPCGLVETYYMRSCPRRQLSSISKLRFVSCDVIQHPFLTILISDRRSRQWWVEQHSFRDRFVPINSSTWHRHRLWLLKHNRSPKLRILAHQWHIWGPVSNLVKLLQRECFQSHSQFSCTTCIYSLVFPNRQIRRTGETSWMHELTQCAVFVMLWSETNKEAENLLCRLVAFHLTIWYLSGDEVFSVSNERG